MIFVVSKMKLRNVLRKYIEIMECWPDNPEMRLNTAIDAFEEILDLT